MTIAGSDTIISSITPGFSCAGTQSGETPTMVIVTDSSGPTANSIATSTAASFTCSGSPVNVTFTTGVQGTVLQPSTSYWLVFSGGGTDLGDEYGTLTTQPEQYSNDSGSTWTAATYNGYFSYIYTQTMQGDIYEANSTNNDFRANNFAGIAESTVSSGANVVVDIDGLTTATTTLTAGGEYYLQNTNGQLGTAAGTNSRKIGIGLGSTGFFIRQDNP